MGVKRPNILFIITDQQRADHLSCAGNPVLKTPYMDLLAERGRRFENFYVNSGICQTNRATIMTGQMLAQHGVRVNGIPISLDSVCYTHLLQAGGYETALFGKAHFQNMTTERPSFRQVAQDLDLPPKELRDARTRIRSGPEYDRELNFQHSVDPEIDERQGDYYGFERFRVCTWHGDDVQGHYTHWLDERFPDAANNRSSVNPEPDPRYTAPQTRKPRMPEELYPTNYVAEMTLEYLDDYARGGQDKPFFVQCSFPDPHHPFTPPGKYWDMYDPADIELTPSFYHQPHDQTPILARMHQELADGTANREWVRPYAVTEDEAKQIIALTYGMVSFIDDSVGRIVTKLKKHGLDENTVIILTSDHGDWMGDHGLMQKALLHYQGLIRVPFIWLDPDDEAPGQTQHEIGCSQDIPNTILARAGLAPSAGMLGEDLNKIMFDGEGSRRDGVVVEQATSLPLPGRDIPLRVKTYVDHDWRLSYYAGEQWGELYDLKNDPDEIVNLWTSEDHRIIRLELMERMLKNIIHYESGTPLQVMTG